MVCGVDEADKLEIEEATPIGLESLADCRAIPFRAPTRPVE
jgi:hypothetical protein